MEIETARHRRFSRTTCGRVFSLYRHRGEFVDCRLESNKLFFISEGKRVPCNRIINNPFMYSVLEGGVCIALGTHFKLDSSGRVSIKLSFLRRICRLVAETDLETDTTCGVALERHKGKERVTLQELCYPSSVSVLAMWIKTAAFFVGKLSGVLYHMYAPILSEYWDDMKDELIAGLQSAVRGDTDDLSRLALLCVPYDRRNRRFPCKIRSTLQATYDSLVRRLGHRLCTNANQTERLDVALYGLSYHSSLRCCSVPALVASLERLLDAHLSGQTRFHFVRSLNGRADLPKVTRASLYSCFAPSGPACVLLDAHDFTYADWVELSKVIVKFNDVYIHCTRKVSFIHKHFVLQLAGALGIELHSSRTVNGSSLVRRILAAKESGRHTAPV
jgi:hypothetical protein